MSNLLRLLFSSFPSSSGFPAGKRNLKTTCSVVQFWEGFAHSNSMTEHSIRIRFIFTYVDNKMVSVQFSSPFQTDPPSQYTYDVQSNTAFLFLWAAVVCLSWFCLLLFVFGFVWCFFLVNYFAQTLYSEQLMPPWNSLVTEGCSYVFYYFFLLRLISLSWYSCSELTEVSCSTHISS